MRATVRLPVHPMPPPIWEFSDMALQTIYFFGQLGDLLERRLEVDLPALPATLAGLRDLLCGLYPDAARALNHARARGCIDGMIMPDSTPLRAGQEIAFLSPLSGG